MKPDVIIVIAAVIGVMLTVAGVAGVWLSLRTAQNSQTLKNFRDASASWREKADALASDLASVQADLAELTAKYTTLLAAHEALQNVITGRSEIAAMSVQMGKYKDEIIREIRSARKSTGGSAG
jgi:nicotinate-nucleotide pyrophosphorylase